ncbi:sensor histidine kinase [uncultured Polaribacter sp.]|uniref:tetratricopeptide repeat-containing sensor histidine kinase n=1 Tax=uncultured Polaribacter sp. TaxID=174711 RepID=UPI0030D92997|tara:strand:- start:6555 stop:8240 length:1686 start_codon:yes stop_codon:yes gene_type:complete
MIQKLQIIFLLICSFSYAQTSKLDSAYYYFKIGEKFDFENMHFDAYENYKKSYHLYTILDTKDSIAKCNLKLFDLINSQNNLEGDSKPYLDAYYSYALEKKDSLMLLSATNRYAGYFWNADTIEVARKYYKKSLKITNNKKFKQYQPSVFTSLAYLYTKTKPDSAQYYFKKTLSSENNKKILLDTHINYAIFFQKQHKFKEALIELKKAEKLNIYEYQLKYNKIIFGKFANCYKEIGDYKKAYEYYEKYNICLDSLNNTAQNIAISDLDKKYQTAEKEKENLELKAKNKETEAKRLKNRNFLIASIIILILGSIIAILSLKNSKRKRILAQQKEDLEKQKNLTLLKEQELISINAMVDGQEKERKQIAEDLHDNLGSVLATLKLHFEKLKINCEKKLIDPEILFNKTENLIDEAYIKVRSIAHAKNSGVIANEGLLVAIKLMADKISSADKIKIEVIDFGLNKRLENSLEITIFRIVQELITNIIKHAEAKNATINISLYDKNLNIIIEDDGKGFDFKKVNFKKGMGISSIKTRIKHLNGSFKIDSTLKKGSSIIIDIPIS